MTVRFPTVTTDFLASQPINSPLNHHQAPDTIARPHPLLELSVAVPARDEQQTIIPTLLALSRQISARGKPLDPRTYEVIVLANGCQDDTATVARAFGLQRPDLRLHVVEIDLPPGDSHIGWARRLAMDLACERLLQVGGPNGIIATSDADTVVGRQWISATLGEVRRGSDAVGGRILLDPDQLAALEPGTRETHLRDVGYRYLVAELESLLDPDPFDPWPRHFQHFGASLAITAESYIAAGGLPVRRSLEDVALYNRLRSMDARIRHSPDVRVWTSSRQVGRTDFGFAVQLRDWSAMQRRNQPFLVESPTVTERRLCARVHLRRLWLAHQAGQNAGNREIMTRAGQLGIPAKTLREALESHRTFGSMFDELQRRGNRATARERHDNLIPIDRAIAALRMRLSVHRRTLPTSA